MMVFKKLLKIKIIYKNNVIVYGEQLFRASEDGSIRGRGRRWRWWKRTTSGLRDRIRHAWGRADRSSSAGLQETDLSLSARCGCGTWTLWRASTLCCTQRGRTWIAWLFWVGRCGAGLGRIVLCIVEITMNDDPNNN